MQGLQGLRFPLAALPAQAAVANTRKAAARLPWRLIGLVFIALAACAGEDRDAGQAIRELASENFETRERATKALQELGLQALPALRAGFDESSDAEVRARLSALLEDLYRRHPEAALQIRLVPEKTKVVLGTDTKWKVRVLFENRTGQPLVVLKPRSNSLERGRTPAYRFTFRDSNGTEFIEWDGPEKMIDVGAEERSDPFTPEHFVTIGPGKTEEIFSKEFDTGRLVCLDDPARKRKLDTAGTYRLCLEYIVPEGIEAVPFVRKLLDHETGRLLERAMKARVKAQPVQIEFAQGP